MGRYRRSMQEMAKKLESGEPLAKVLAIHGAPKDLTSVIEICSETGKWNEVLLQYVHDRRRGVDSGRKLKWGLAYPIGIFLLALIIAIEWLLWLVPEVNVSRVLDFETATLREGGILSVSQFIRNHGLEMLGAIATVSALVWKYRKWIPIFSSVNHVNGLSSFCRLMSIMVANGAPADRSVRTAGQAVACPRVRAGSKTLAHLVASGLDIKHSIRGLTGLPPQILQLLVSGNSTADTANALLAAADIYDARVETQVDTVLAIVRPTLMILSGVIIVWLAGSLQLGWLGGLSGVL